MNIEDMRCPLCGQVFDPTANTACRGCPLGVDCPLVCCPSCGYTTIDPSQSTVSKLVEGLKSRGRDFERPAKG